MASAENRALFDGKLELGRDIPSLWREGMPYKPVLPARDMRLAEEGRLLLRQHPRERFLGVRSSEQMQDMLDTASRHFKVLQAMGMSVVSHETVINPGQWPEDDFEWDDQDPVAFSATPYIPGLIPLAGHSGRIATAEEVPREKVEELVLEPLERYVDWGVSTGEPRLLLDVFTPDQYSIHAPSRVLALHDIGPQMHPTETISREVREDMAADFAHIGR